MQAEQGADQVMASSFVKTRTGYSFAARSGPLATAPEPFEYDPQRIRESAPLERAFLSVVFTGTVPRRETSIAIGVQGWMIPFSVDSVTTIAIPPGRYAVSLIRSGAIKAGTLTLVAGEFVVVRFRFSRLGITWSGWSGMDAFAADKAPPVDTLEFGIRS